jgi:RNA 2',3'-cyclic 3'-phosphodiesterase
MPEAPRDEASRRLFFALWPDAELRAAAAQRVAALVPRGAGRPQRPDQLHVTLVFLGGVAERRLADVRAAADASAGAPLEIEFDRLDHWRKPRVLCLAANVVPPALAALVDSLRASLAARDLPTEDRPYRPHLTLARKVARFDGPAAVEPLAWRATSFALVESCTDRAGSRYEPLAHWPLAGAPAHD